ncbi:acidic mammalian chitinase [Biomphalaria glabrata]|nr:acidic mammalian chitinase [Biomphalaria glabrata]
MGVAGTDAVCWWACVVDPGSGCSLTMYSCRTQLRLPFIQASDESVASVVAWTLVKTSNTDICRPVANKLVTALCC